MDIAYLSAYNADKYTNKIATFNPGVGSERELRFWGIKG